jgi:hypothetical protein
MASTLTRIWVDPWIGSPILGGMTKRFALLAFVLMMMNACGGGGPSAPSPTLLQVGGSYATAVALTEDTCGGVTVQSRPTVITHTPGQTRFTLAHAGLNCAGTVSGDGSFVTDPVSLPDPMGTATVAISGRFRTTGFDADTRVDVARTGGGSCRYVVRWTATKEGSPNVLPGG